MKTKSYRATTMREALEKVKEELGEDALVLDSRRVRAGGLLGFGSTEQIEVRVSAAPAETSEPEARAADSARRKSFLTSLRLGTAAAAAANTDDGNNPSEATPREDAREGARRPTPASVASAARAYAGVAARGAEESESAATATRTHASATRTPAPFVGVEVAETAPRIVHKRPAPSGASQADAPAAQQQAERRDDELSKLRAELREMKFALSTFASRATAPQPSSVSEDSDLVYDSPFYEAYLDLASTGLAPDVARRSVREAATTGGAEHMRPSELARTALLEALPHLVSFGEDPVDELHASRGALSAIALIGPTGVGKTTTLAKLAARVALRERRRVELITLDTYRIAAVEQLRTYAEIIGAGFHVPRTVLELDALLTRLSSEATVLVDTTGRSPSDLADQLELADYLRRNDSVLKCLVLQATTHPSDAATAARKFGLYGANRLAITKLDETSLPGASVQIARDSRLPLSYICAGQRVPEDIERATPDALAERVLRAAAALAVAA